MSYSTHNNRRATSSGNPVSLFPFLAVLLCTMGALISILLIIARQAQLSTEELIQEMFAESGEIHSTEETHQTEDDLFTLKTPEENGEKIVETPIEKTNSIETELETTLPTPLETEPEDPEFAGIETEKLEKRLEEIEAIQIKSAWHIKTLLAARNELEKNAQSARIALSTTQENRERLHGQMETLRNALLQLQNSETEKEPETLQKEIAEKQKALEKLQEEWEKAENSAPKENGSYAILPHAGVNGTRRYPLYVECREDGAWLMPENLKLNALDFEGTLTMENPLEMALIAKRQYLLRNGFFRETPGNEQEPYPLIIVRPSGILYLYMVKASLQSWKSEFGYELVDEKMPIAYPPNDENLKLEMVKAIEGARHRQREIAAMAPTLSRNGGGAGKLAYRPTSRGGVAMNIDPDSRLARTLARSARPRPAMGGMAVEGTSVNQSASDEQTANHSLAPNVTGNFAGTRTAQTSGAYGSNGQTALQQMPEANSPNGFGAAASDFSQWKTIQPGEASESTDVKNTREAGKTDSGLSSDGVFALNSPQDVKAAESQESLGGNGSVSEGNASQAAHSNGIAENCPNASASGTSSIAESKGENWALENYHPNISTLTRPVPLECHADRFILSAIPGVPAEEIPITTPFQTGVKLANAISAQAKLWGEAGPGMIWKPILRVRVAPDAREQFERLKILLDGSGLIVEEVTP